jgi:hypothetical protein
MSIELPTLRLGFAGFSAVEEQQLADALPLVSPSHIVWHRGKFGDADAWWFNGSRTQLLSETLLRVQPGMPTERSVTLNLPEVDRPVAFSKPLLARDFDPMYRFDPHSMGEMRAVLEKFGAWLRPLVAQFCLASQIYEQETALGSGVYDLSLNGTLIAVVDMRGDVGVLPTAGPADFDDAIWGQRTSREIPANFVRTSLAHLMWQYAVRTSRDLLPRHYRTQAIYFRRPPRLAQRLVKDSHLLLIRELAIAPGTFDELVQRTGLPGPILGRTLAALYLVGSVTSNPKRASGGIPLRRHEGPDSLADDPSAFGGGRPPVPADLTAPAPIGPV